MIYDVSVLIGSRIFNTFVRASNAEEATSIIMYDLSDDSDKSIVSIERWKE